MHHTQPLKITNQKKHLKHTYQVTTVNLAQAKELSLRQGEPLVQAARSCLGEIAHIGHVEVLLKLAPLAKASGLRLDEPSKQRGGELLLSSLKRELLA